MSARYQQYLASREWAVLKQTVKRRSGGFCERSRSADWTVDSNPWPWHNVPATQTHHLTYERLYHERPEDLLHVCAECHEYLSAVRDFDPVLLGEVYWHLQRLHPSLSLTILTAIKPLSVGIRAEGFGAADIMPLEEAADRLRHCWNAFQFFTATDEQLATYPMWNDPDPATLAAIKDQVVREVIAEPGHVE